MAEPGNVNRSSWWNPFSSVSSRNQLPIGRDRATVLYPTGTTITTASKTGTQFRPSIDITATDAHGNEMKTTLDVSRAGTRQIMDVSVSADGKGVTATFSSGTNPEESITWQLVAD